MTAAWPSVPLGEVIEHRKEFIIINDLETYRRPRVQLHAQGIVLRDAVPGAEIKTKRQQVARAGEFLVAEIDAKVGGFGIVPHELDGSIVSSHYFLYGHRPERLDNRYLGWFVKTRAFRQQIEAQGSTNYAAIRSNDVLGYEIPLPPLDEQRRIVARIEELAAKVEEAKRVRLLALDETAAIFGKAVGTLFDNRSGGWTAACVDNIAKSLDAGWSPQCENVPANEAQWGVLKTTAVQWSEFWPHENKRLPLSAAPRPELSVKAGDVLVTRAGPMKRVGVPATAREDYPNLMISDKLIRIRPNLKIINPRFLEYALSSPQAQAHLVARKTGLADAQVNISQAILRATPFAYPSIRIQDRIVAELDALQAKINAVKDLQSNTEVELNAMLPAILDKAFKGEM